MKDLDAKDMANCIIFAKQHPEFRKDVLNATLYDDNELNMFFSTKDEIFIINFMKYITGIMYEFWRKDDIKNKTKSENLYDRCCDAIAALVDEQPTASPQQFTKSLTRPQQKYLYKKLTENAFLPPKSKDTDTDFEAFCYVFGGDEKPDDFKPLEWQPKSKQLLRELLEPLQHPDIKTKADFERIVPNYFIDTYQNRIVLPKNKVVPSTLSDKIKDIIKNLATL